MIEQLLCRVRVLGSCQLDARTYIIRIIRILGDWYFQTKKRSCDSGAAAGTLFSQR